MKKINNSFKLLGLAMLLGTVVTTSCNKELDNPGSLVKPAYPSGATVAAAIAANPDDSLFNRLIIRSGTNAALFSDSTKTFTLFVPDNNGMKVFINGASGGAVPLAAPNSVFSSFISNNLRPGQCDTLIKYVTIGQKYPAASLGTAFPNFPLTSQIVLDPNQPFLRLPIFPLRGTTYSYVNNIPITGVDQLVANGVIHHTFTLVTPPSSLLKALIATDTLLNYFRAAVTRADSGSVGLSKLDSLMGYGVTNMTVLAPSDAAFKSFIYTFAYGSYLRSRPTPYTAIDSATANATGNGAANAGPAFLATNNVSTAQIKGIIAYHFLASLTPSTTSPYQPNVRVFSVNVPSTAGSFVKTLVNGAVAAHPGILAQAIFTGPVASTVNFTGLGSLTGGAPFSSPAANVILKDRNAVNGVYHVIDRILLPQ
jgi:Fasciclin domain